MAEPFDQLTVPTELAPGRFHWAVPDGWQQGPGAFGGLVIATLCRAAIAFEGDAARAPRAVSAELVGPALAGDATIEVRLLRRGGAVTTVEAILSQPGEAGADAIRARASFVLGGARDKPTEFGDRPERTPDSLDWAAAPAFPMEVGRFPAFARHFEFRSVGAPPFSAGAEPRAGGWVRAKVPPRAMGPAEVAAYADAWWPAGFSVEAQPRAVATIAFQLQWLVDPASLEPTEPLLCLARVVGGQDGYVAETRELFDPRGRLVALNQQTFVWI